MRRWIDCCYHSNTDFCCNLPNVFFFLANQELVTQSPKNRTSRLHPFLWLCSHFMSLFLLHESWELQKSAAETENSISVYFRYYRVYCVIIPPVLKEHLHSKLTKQRMEQLFATVSLGVYKSTTHQVFTRVHSWQTCQTQRPAEQACAVCEWSRRHWGSITVFRRGHCSKLMIETKKTVHALEFVISPPWFVCHTVSMTTWLDFYREFLSQKKIDVCPKFCSERACMACH